MMTSSEFYKFVHDNMEAAEYTEVGKAVATLASFYGVTPPETYLVEYFGNLVDLIVKENKSFLTKVLNEPALAQAVLVYSKIRARRPAWDAEEKVNKLRIELAEAEKELANSIPQVDVSRAEGNLASQQSETGY